MSRQYLKELQERAQKLLEASSDEEEEEINAYTATQMASKSPARIDLDDFLFQDQSEADLSDQDLPKSTDVELLKKCIALTNQNNTMRVLIDRQDSQIRSLQAQLQSKIKEESSINSKSHFKTEEVTPHDREIKMLASELADLQREISDMKVQKSLLKHQYEEFQRQKEEFRREKQNYSRSVGVRRKQREEIDAREEYTVKTIKAELHQVESQRMHEYQARIRRLQGLLREERAKISKLCQFINSQIPGLKDKVVEMTAKLDLQVSRYLLRDCQF